MYYTPSERGRDERYFSPALYYPAQTDPKEQTVPLIYNDTQQKDFDFGAKVAFDHECITVASALGAVFDVWDRWIWDEISETAKQGKLINGGKLEWTGNQYAHTMFSPQDNSISILTETSGWSYNPKICGALQPKIEIILSCGGFRLPADSTYIANFRTFYGVSAGQEDKSDAWDDYPPVNDDKWGENESGFELFLKKRGYYDW